VLSTRIATSETIGILPISKSLAESYNITTLPRPHVVGVPHHRDTPVHLTRLSTRTLNIYRYLQLRQRVLYAVVPVHTHKEYITFKIINDQKFRKTGKTAHPPHEHWKNIDFTKLAQSWNDMVYLQPRAVTDSNQRLYYKLPQQLEAHHKKTLLWNSELATLAGGTNFAARKALLAILEAPDNYADVLPAIPLPEPMADGELDLSIGGLFSAQMSSKIYILLTPISGSNDLSSFNPMAEPGEQPDSEFIDLEQGSSSAEIPSMHAILQTMPVESEITQTAQGLHLAQHRPSLPRVEHQLLLPGASAPVANMSSKAPKRCAPCAKNFCYKRLDCVGRGGQKLCKCGHPPLAPGEKLRVTEAQIIARLAAQQG
jgi:hypothetical protein